MRARLGLVGIGVLALALLSGCGSSSKSSSSSGTTATTAASGSATTVAGGGGTLPGTGGSGTPVKVVVTDTKGLDAATMSLKATPDTVKAGAVTFTVTNNGTIDHEVVVLKLAAGESATGLKITTWDGEANRVSESSSVGETGDPPLKPGETRSFTVPADKMTAGNYALVCNIAKHYSLGMKAPFTVTS